MTRHLCLLFALSLSIQTPTAKASPSYYDYSQGALFALTFAMQWNRIYYPKVFFVIRFANLLNALSYLYKDCSNLREKERSEQAHCALNLFFAAVDSYYLGQTIYDFRHPTTTVLQISQGTSSYHCPDGKTITLHRSTISNADTTYELIGRVPSRTLELANFASTEFPLVGSPFPVNFMRSSRNLRIYFGNQEIFEGGTPFKTRLHNLLKFGSSKKYLSNAYQFVSLVIYAHSGMEPGFSDDIFDPVSAAVGSPFWLKRGEDIVHAAIFMGEYNGEFLTLSKLGAGDIVFASLQELQRIYNADGFLTLLPDL